MEEISQKTKRELYMEKLSKFRDEKKRALKENQPSELHKKSRPSSVTSRLSSISSSLKPSSVSSRPTSVSSRRSSISSKPSSVSSRPSSVSSRRSSISSKPSSVPSRRHSYIVPSRYSNISSKHSIEKTTTDRLSGIAAKPVKRKSSAAAVTNKERKLSSGDAVLPIEIRLQDYKERKQREKQDKLRQSNRPPFTPAASKRPNPSLLEQRSKKRSDVVRKTPAHKPVGILKPSCLASSQKQQDGTNSSDVATHRLSHAATNNTLAVSGIPRAVVTPGMGHSVRFVSPDELKDGQHSAKFRKTPQPCRQKSEICSMRGNLNHWLQSKGKTPTRFRHLMCFDEEMSAKKKDVTQTKCALTVEELTEQQKAMEFEDLAVNLLAEFEDSHVEEPVSNPLQEKLESMLQECSILFETGCPADSIIPWLNSIHENIPIARDSACYYITKIKVLQSTGDLDRVLEVFEDAVRHNAQPSDKMASVLTETIKQMAGEIERKARHQPRTPRKSEVQTENIFESSAIKYSVKQVTPFSKKRHASGTDSSSTPCVVVTPVRRSTRRSLVDLPESLHDKIPTYESFQDLTQEEKDQALFQPNRALEEVFLEAEEDDCE